MLMLASIKVLLGQDQKYEWLSKHTLLHQLNISQGKSKFLDLEIDRPTWCSFETDKLYWIALGLILIIIPNLSSFPNRELRFNYDSNPPESPAFFNRKMMQIMLFLIQWQQNINFNDLENVPNSGNLSQHASAIWFRLYNPNSDVGLGNRGPRSNRTYWT